MQVKQLVSFTCCNFNQQFFRYLGVKTLSIYRVLMETYEEQNQRLMEALSNSDVNFLSGSYDYEEFNATELDLKFNVNALALIRDGSRWSQLVNVDEGSFSVFSIHFNGVDNVNGFVGWFASFLKHKFNIGLIVLVGSNSLKKGVYDYYGVPIARIAEVEREMALMSKKG